MRSVFASLVIITLLITAIESRVMTNLERQMEAAKQFEASKKKNVDLRATATEARQSLNDDLERAKRRQKERREGLEAKRAEAAKQWKQKQEAEEKARNTEEASVSGGYEYVYVDDEGNIVEGEDEEDEDTEENTDEYEDENEELDADEHFQASPSPRTKPMAVLSHGYSKSFEGDGFFTLKRTDLADFLPELQNKSSCLFRNISHLTRLRDDHQVLLCLYSSLVGKVVLLWLMRCLPAVLLALFMKMNLKLQRESLKERRREKRDKKSQEVLDEIIELEDTRVLMSRMSSAELLEQKEYQKNLTKVDNSEYYFISFHHFMLRIYVLQQVTSFSWINMY